MNWLKLVAYVRSKGYTGKADPDEITKWLADTGLSLEGTDGKPIDVKALHTKGAKLTIESDEPEATDEPAETPEVPATKADSPGGGRPGIGHKRVAIGDGIGGAPVIHNRSEKSVYNRNAKAGKAVFDDADQAERAGAYFRLCIAKQLRLDDYRQKGRDLEIVGKDAGTTINTLGGATVPDDFRPNVIFLTEKFGAARRLANVVGMTRDTATFPRITDPLAMTAIAEAGSMSATDVSWDNVQLTAKKWYVLIKSSTELLEDSAVNIADVVAKQIARAQARSEDLTYFLGDGSSTYNGDVGLISGLASGAYVAQGTSNTWATQVEADILNMVGRVEAVDPANCAFACSRQYFWQVFMRLAQAKSGNNVNTTLMGADRGPNGEDAIAYGFPVFFSQVLPTATNTSQKCLYFGDFKAGSMLGDRRDLQIAYSDQAYFTTDQIAWRATSRFTVNIHTDGQGQTYGPITALKTS